MRVDPTILQPPSLEARPYRGDEFVNRDPERRQIQRKVDEGLAGYPITQPVIHVWGLRGAGKSWLLNYLREQYRFTPGKQVEKDGTLCVLADFHEIRFRFSTWEPIRMIKLLERFVEQLADQLGAKLQDAAGDELAEFVAERQKLEEANGKREASSLADRFVALMIRLSRRYVLLLLFDTVEKLDEDSFFWLESHVIEPIARTNGAIVVVAGRKEIPRWREFGVRQRLVVWELTSFDSTGTAEQLARRGYGDLGDVVHSLSSGHPYVNQILGEALGQLAGRQPIAGNFEEAHRSEVVALLGAIEAEFLKDVESETHRNALRALSTLRKFNVESARHMLNGNYAQQTDSYFLRLFEDLEDTNLVWWSSDQRGYVVALALRRLMGLYALKKEEPPISFRAGHTKAYEMYKSWMIKYPHDRAALVVEALYHLANAERGKEPAEIQDRINEFLDWALDRDFFTTDGADALFQSVYRDVELQDPYGGMPGEIYSSGVDRIRLFRDKIAEDEPAEGMQNEHRVQTSSLPTRSVRGPRR